MFGDFGGFSGFGGFDDGSVNRSGFASISSSALASQDTAIDQFLDFLATVDTKDGFNKEKELKFHLVKDARTALNRVVKEHKCKSTTRTLTRTEQDRVNKARKSLMKYTTVIVTPKAQIDYILSHLEVANKAREKAGLKRIAKEELEKEKPAPKSAPKGKKRTSEAAELKEEEEEAEEGPSSKKVKSEEST
ncbi:hypothetical protein BDY24DRAFT_383743 [Mrakia frigida]|uniref:uncharacterized protein n=1 Tax=Mrakia frigida TaxID=29902 RepID=UPI003FCC1B99